MLAALLLAIAGVVLVLLARAAAKPYAEADELAHRLLDLAVRDRGEARRLLREHPELLEARYVHDQTPLHFCAVEGATEGVRFFADAGVPVDAVNDLGDTALVDASTVGNLEVVKVLLGHGANPNAPTRARENVLHDAVTHGYVEVVAALLDAGARADYVTGQGETVWDAVPKAPARRDEVVKVLESHGVNR